MSPNTQAGTRAYKNSDAMLGFGPLGIVEAGSSQPRLPLYNGDTFSNYNGNYLLQGVNWKKYKPPRVIKKFGDEGLPMKLSIRVDKSEVQGKNKARMSWGGTKKMNDK